MGKVFEVEDQEFVLPYYSFDPIAEHFKGCFEHKCKIELFFIEGSEKNVLSLAASCGKFLNITK